MLSFAKLRPAHAALSILTLAVSACGQATDPSTPMEPPTLALTLPADADIAVPLDAAVFAVFDLSMDPLDEVSFTLRQQGALVDGTVGNSDDGKTAVFVPAADLAADTVFTATITDALSSVGGSFEGEVSWTFTTASHDAEGELDLDGSVFDDEPTTFGDEAGLTTFAKKPRPPKPTPVVLGPAPVLLGTAGNYAALAKTGISTVPSSTITGNIAVSPAAATYITGFSLILDSKNAFSRSTQVVGKVYAADYATPTPSNLTTAVSNMQTAYNDAAGRPTPDFLELGTGEIGSRTLVPGLYKWTTSVTMSTDVVLSGGPNDVWIFQTTGDVSMAAGVRITLQGGALAKNIFWQVAGNASFGTTSHFEGIMLCMTDVTLQTGATMNGRILSQTAITLQQATLTRP